MGRPASAATSDFRSTLRARAPAWAAVCLGLSLGLGAGVPTVAHATEPVAKIAGKTTVPANQGVVLLDGRQSVADPPGALKWKWKGVGPEPTFIVANDQASGRPVLLLLLDPPIGTFRFELIAIGKANDGTVTADADVIDITVGGVTPVPVPTPTPTPGPVPPTPGPIPPTPTPTPGPPTPGPTPPTPTPAPIPAPGLHVLMVYESGELSKLPPAQLSVLYAKSIRDYLQAKCPVGPDGKTKEWRIWDQNTDASGDAPVWRDAMKRPRTSVPWIIVSNGTSGYEGPLPASIDEALKLLKQFGGD
jgi:hypothetical protein